MSEPKTLKRPKPGDGEEELFRMQDEFMRSKQEPSAKVINLHAHFKPVDAKQSGNANDSESIGKVRSKHAECKAPAQKEKLSTSRSDGPTIDLGAEKSLKKNKTEEPLSNSVQCLPLNPSCVILGNIVEKKYNLRNDPLQFPSCGISENRLTGFPNVFLVDQKACGNNASLFLQQMSEKSRWKTVATTSRVIDNRGNSAKKTSAEKSQQGEIHEVNLEKLRQMSEEEILRAKSQLESSLSSELLSFLKARKENVSAMESRNRQISNNEMEMDDKVDADSGISIRKIESVDKIKGANGSAEISTKIECAVDPMEDTSAVELAETAVTKGWLHMDTIEHEKLEWTKGVVPVKLEKTMTEQPYNARFDFNGVLLPFRDDSLTLDKGLHHHGEEADRPGYSLQELLQLCRSSNQQQRCTALLTLANVMEKSRKGWYDRVLEPAPLVALSEKNILLLLRFSLDDTSVAVVTSAIQALRAFLYSEADEICLDRLFGWHYPDGKILEPELPAPKTDVADTSNLKDHELAQLDTVAAAIRSDMVLRIRYILSEMRPPPIGVTAALEILTRLARQSCTTALNIACTPRLLEIIVQNFIPLSIDQLTGKDGAKNAYGVPSVTAVRFCRVLVAYAGKPVAERLNNLKIVHSIMMYTTNDAKLIGIRLSIESLRLWKLLLLNNVAMDSIGGARLTFLTQLQLLLSNHDLGRSSELTCEHAAALVDVSTHETSLRAYISTLLTKWSLQLGKLSSPTWSQTKLVAVTLTASNDISAFKCPWILSSNIGDSLCSTSNLLSDYASSRSRDPSSLPSLGSLMDGSLLQPSVSLNSVVPFFATWINALRDNRRHVELRELMGNENFMKYIRRLSSENWNLERSWYTRGELFLVTGIVRLVMSLGNAVDEVARRLVLRIGIKLVSTLPSDASLAVKEILGYVLNDESLKLEKLASSLTSLKLNRELDGRVDASMNLPKDMLSGTYGEYVSSTGSWQQSAMPKDWLYLSLVAAYTRYKNGTADWDETDTPKILVQLRLELTMPEIVVDLSPSLRFSRLVLVYLCDTVYLNRDVSILLSETLKRLLERHHKKLNFSSELPGLSSFTDLFTALCETFCANSYGNDGFSMALLVPLAQRHDVHYRKLLWSEHAAVLRYIRLKRDNLAIPFTEYLYPIEDDPTLVESYITALVRGIVREAWCPLMYDIALHHSAMYLRRSDKLAVSMRKKILHLRDGQLSECLLNYEPPKIE